MVEKISKFALRLMAATLFLILFNTFGMRYGYELPINLFNIVILKSDSFIYDLIPLTIFIKSPI